LEGERKLEQRALGPGAFLLSSSELAALAHLPEPQTLPGLLRAGARSVPPPAGLPEEGKPLGVDARGEPVALAIADARYHLHLLGPTGVGKSRPEGSIKGSIPGPCSRTCKAKRKESADFRRFCRAL
jgi:hypothetical protein